MSSPFPGMDPYLEAPYIWPDFHEAFATEIRGQLNANLPPPYYARLEMRPEVGIVEDEAAARRIVPDVAVARRGDGREESVAVLEKPIQISPFLEVCLGFEKTKHVSVEIRDPSQGHRLITLIEIVSPSNKRPGPDRKSYRKKQQEIIASDANLVEVDLLRKGQRLYWHLSLKDIVSQQQPPPEYLVLVSRAWQRAEGRCQIFPVLLEESLPTITVPLREGQPEVALILQEAMNRAYDSGPYRRGAVNYQVRPKPAVPPAKVRWLNACLEAVRQHPSSG